VAASAGVGHRRADALATEAMRAMARSTKDRAGSKRGRPPSNLGEERVTFRAGDVRVTFEGPATALHDFLTRLAALLRHIELE
jgi:hypothetical protein